MDKQSALKREVVLVEVGAVVLMAIACWLVPKYFRLARWHIALTGITSTLALNAAAYRVSLLEKEERMDRAMLAAQQDLFTSELATEVYLGQLQKQRMINAMLTPEHQGAENEPLQPQGIQAIASTPTHQEAPQSEPRIFDISELGDYPSVIIYGPQSSGKTSLTRLIIQQRLQAGHTCEALDPHGSRWPCPTVGAGMDYDAVETRLREISTLIKERYQYCKENELDPNDVDFPPVTFICDELTNWGPRMDNAVVVNFIRECWSDIRKVDIMALFANHANTIEGGLAGAKGLADLRDKGCIQIELFTQPNPQTGKAMPAGKGRMKLPGQPPVEVVIPQLESNLRVQTPVQTTNLPNPYHEPPEPLMNKRFSSMQGRVQLPVQVQEPQVQTPFSYLNPNLQAQIAAAIATNQPKVKSIQNLLGISKGGSSAWQQASSDWDAMKALLP